MAQSAASTKRPDDRTEPEGWRFHRSWWAIVTTRPDRQKSIARRPSMLAFTVASGPRAAACFPAKRISGAHRATP
jgi:hypothetical protein